MKSNRRAATIAGVLFLVAMVASLGGGLWLESILTAEDYLTTVSANETQVLIGVLLELINCAAVVGIAAVLFAVLKMQSEALAVGYLGARLIEAAVLAAAVISPLLLVTLSREYLAAGAADASYFQTLGTLAMAARGHLASLLTPLSFGLAALLLYYALYQTRLVPRFIPVWGFIGVAAMLTWNLLEAFGISVSAGMVFALPIMLNEIFLGFWLIVRGFNSPATASGSTTQA